MKIENKNDIVDWSMKLVTIAPNKEYNFILARLLNCIFLSLE